MYVAFEVGYYWPIHLFTLNLETIVSLLRLRLPYCEALFALPYSALRACVIFLLHTVLEKDYLGEADCMTQTLCVLYPVQ